MGDAAAPHRDRYAQQPDQRRRGAGDENDHLGERTGHPYSITPNLLSPTYTKVSYLDNANQYAAFQPTNLGAASSALIDGNAAAPTTPWVPWEDVFRESVNGPQSDLTHIQLDEWNTMMQVNAITLWEDPNNPGSWVRDATLDYWNVATQSWVTGPTLLSDAATHTHVLTPPIQSPRVRVTLPPTCTSNLRLGEVVINGALLGCSHPDVVAGNNTCVLFDENPYPFQGQLMGSYTFQYSDAYSGALCFATTAPGVNSPDWGLAGLFYSSLQDWNMQIVQTPQHANEFRYLQFAWKAVDSTVTGLTLEVGNITGLNGNNILASMFCGTWCGLSTWPYPTIIQKQISSTVPTSWTLVTVDLWALCQANGGINITGMDLCTTGGSGKAEFDAIKLFKTDPTGTPYTAPTVSSFTTNNSSYTASYSTPASVVMSVQASDPNSSGSITKIEFYNGDLLLGMATSSPYSATWTVSTPGSYTLTARAYDTYGLETNSGPVNITVTNAQVATPYFNEAPGVYASAQTVGIGATTGGAAIYYTTDGSTPSSTNGTLYSSPVLISTSVTLQAIAYANGLTTSQVASGVYDIMPSLDTWYTDASTEGCWWSSTGGYVYGSNGYVLCAWNGGTDVVNLTGSYVKSVTPTTQNNYSWGASTDPRAAINPATGTRDAACWFSGGYFNALVTLNNPNDGLLHRLAVYCLDWDNEGRTETFDLRNPYTGTSELSGGPVSLSNFSNGIWVVFYFTGNVELLVTDTNGNSCAAISAMVFDSQCAAPSFSPAANTFTTSTAVTITTATSGASIRYTTNGTTPSSTVGTVYSSAVNITATSTLQAIAYDTGLTNSAVSSGVYTIQCAAPSFSPAANTFTISTAVTITSATSGASIRYTTNGTTPSSTVGTVYSSPVTISATSTLQAIAYETGLLNSTVTSGVYTINGPCATPTFNPAAGTFTTSTSVTISSTTGGATINYTTNGATPSSTVGTVYTSPVSLTATSTLQAIAYETGYSNSSVASGVYTIQCATPTFSPAAGTYTTSTSVTITTTTSGATIRYTTNGATPSSTVGTVYASPVSLTASSTLQAIAYETGLTNSAVTSGVYTIQCAAPTFNPAAGAYGPAQSVTISTATSGASIRYTTNGATPSSTTGTVYSSPVSISATATLEAIAYETGLTNSTVTTGVYTINGACAAPTFSPAAGSYTSAMVTISTTTSGATINYTTNGTTPSSTVGTVYSSPVAIGQTGTLQAIAYKAGYSNSNVSSAAYTLYIGTTTTGGNNTSITANEMRGTRFQAGSSITVSHIALDIGSSVTGNIQCAIYTDSSGVPGTFLMGTNALSNPGTGWKTFALTSSQALTSGTYYWLLFWSAGNYKVYNTSSGTSWYRSLTYGSWPSSAGSGTTETRTWSIYAY